MSLWNRFYNVLRARQIDHEIDEELELHLAEAVERGRDPEEARRAFGSRLRIGEQIHDIRVLPWLDSLRADAVFGWRQFRKHKVASGAAILSLGLAAGACTSDSIILFSSAAARSGFASRSARLPAVWPAWWSPTSSPW